MWFSHLIGVRLQSGLILRPSLGLGAFISLGDHCQGLSEWGWPFNAPRARTLIKSHPGWWRLAELHSAIPSEAEPRVSHTQAFRTHARHNRHESDILFSLGARGMADRSLTGLKAFATSWNSMAWMSRGREWLTRDRAWETSRPHQQEERTLQTSRERASME